MSLSTGTVVERFVAQVSEDAQLVVRCGVALNQTHRVGSVRSVTRRVRACRPAANEGCNPVIVVGGVERHAATLPSLSPSRATTHAAKHRRAR
jgi:hypothetical protein